MEYKIESRMKKKTLTRSELKAYKRMFPEVMRRIEMRDMKISNGEASRLTALMVRLGLRQLDYYKETIEDKFEQEYEIPEMLANGSFDFVDRRLSFDTIKKYSKPAQEYLYSCGVKYWSVQGFSDIYKCPHVVKMFLERMDKLEASEVILGDYLEVERIALRGRSWSGMAKGILYKWDIQDSSHKSRYRDFDDGSYIRMESRDLLRRLETIEKERKKKKEQRSKDDAV